jgi:hypothetical protein
MVIKGLRIIFPTLDDRRARRLLETTLRDELERSLVSTTVGLFR